MHKIRERPSPVCYTTANEVRGGQNLDSAHVHSAGPSRSHCRTLNAIGSFFLLTLMNDMSPV